MKLFILGFARHGKDTVAEIIRDYSGLTFESSSHIACESVVIPHLKELGIEYDSIEEAYADRMHHRTAWYDAITAFNIPDRCKLSTLIFNLHDIYVGIRNREEFLASKHMSDLAIWVDAYPRVRYDDPTCKIHPNDADVIIKNQGTVEELTSRVHRLMNALRPRGGETMGWAGK